MKETTKPKNAKQSHLLKRDLVEIIAALPLPTPLARARGEGWGSASPKFEARNSKIESSSKREIQKTSNIEPQISSFELRESAGNGRAMVNLQFPQFADIAARRDAPLPLFASVNTNPDNGIPINKRMI
jgi:hypothetical protein